MLHFLDAGLLQLHLLVLLSLWTSEKALPLKIQHIACQKIKAAYFPCLCSATKSLNSLGARGYCVERE